jgi:hypothetical protein
VVFVRVFSNMFALQIIHFQTLQSCTIARVLYCLDIHVIEYLIPIKLSSIFVLIINMVTTCKVSNVQSSDRLELPPAPKPGLRMIFVHFVQPICDQNPREALSGFHNSYESKQLVYCAVQ